MHSGLKICLSFSFFFAKLCFSFDKEKEKMIRYEGDVIFFLFRIMLEI